MNKQEVQIAMNKFIDYHTLKIRIALQLGRSFGGIRVFDTGDGSFIVIPDYVYTYFMDRN